MEFEREITGKEAIRQERYYRQRKIIIERKKEMGRNKSRKKRIIKTWEIMRKSKTLDRRKERKEMEREFER